jgi:hypothetical protein
MKSYIADDQYRLVGKAWEVRQQLRRMAKASKPGESLGDFLTGLHIHPSSSVKQAPRKPKPL